MTFDIFFALVIVPLSIIGLGLLCYYITGKQEEQESQKERS
ncbi:hypothetical protein [Bacillus shivajii]|nr:hypothetical protein [Bacillus shivajii]